MLTLNALGGDDVINASVARSRGIQLTMNGGLGEDILIGSEGNDLVNGGDGNDTALMGAGDDTFVWNPGDDNDTLEGQAGADTMLFNGASVAELIDIFANGGRVLFTRNIANVVMDLNDVESHRLQRPGRRRHHHRQRPLRHRRRPRSTSISPCRGSGVGDGAADTVIINGTNGDDVILDGDASGTSVTRPGRQVIVIGVRDRQ